MKLEDLKTKLKDNKHELSKLQDMLKTETHCYEKLALEQNIATVERNITVLDSMIATVTKSGYIKLSDGSKIKVK